MEARVSWAVATAELIVFARGSGEGEVFVVGAAVMGGESSEG